MDKQLTSVFSDYESLDNNSINSRQLQFWLKQTSSPQMPKTGHQWTFMSNASSKYQPQQLSFGHKNLQPEFVSHQQSQFLKQNSPFLSNQNHSQSFEHRKLHKTQKSKSYVNAMIALQKRIKQLQGQNQLLQNRLQKNYQDHKKSYRQSSMREQQLIQKINKLQPNSEKLTEQIQHKKRLQQQKQQKSRKLRVMQKKLHQYKIKYEQLRTLYEQALNQKKQILQKTNKLESNNVNLQRQAKRLLQKTKQLETIKQQSTANILQKYNESIEVNQQLQKQNQKLKKQFEYLKKNYKTEEAKILQKYERETQKQLEQIRRLEKMQEHLKIKDSIVEQKKQQNAYFKKLYERKDQEYMEAIQKHSQVCSNYQQQIIDLKNKLILQKQKTMQLSNLLKVSQKQNDSHTLKGYISKRQNIRIGKQESQSCINQPLFRQQHLKQQTNSEIIKLPQTVAYANRRQKQQSLDGFASEADDQRQVAPQPLDQSAINSIETKSVEKRRNNKLSKSNEKMNSESGKKRRKKSYQNKSQHNSIILKKPVHLPKSKRRANQNKSCQGCKTNNISHRTKKDLSDAGIQAKTQTQHRITFEANQSAGKQENHINSYLYSAPYQQWPQQEIREFQDCFQTPPSHPNYNSMLLVELQKQLLELYEQQQKLLIASNDEYMSQSERSQFFGRLKQINEQLRVKNQRVCQIKSQL